MLITCQPKKKCELWTKQLPFLHWRDPSRSLLVDKKRQFMVIADDVFRRPITVLVGDVKLAVILQRASYLIVGHYRRHAIKGPSNSS